MNKKKDLRNENFNDKGGNKERESNTNTKYTNKNADDILKNGKGITKYTDIPYI